MFDWVAFFRNNRIEYVEVGPNVARGNVNIRCPWCGTADESHHMGVSLSGAGFGCWRSDAHRGKRPARLIQALLKCTFEEAAKIEGRAARAPVPSEDTLLASLRALAGGSAAPSDAPVPAEALRAGNGGRPGKASRGVLEAAPGHPDGLSGGGNRGARRAGGLGRGNYPSRGTGASRHGGQEAAYGPVKPGGKGGGLDRGARLALLPEFRLLKAPVTAGNGMFFAYLTGADRQYTRQEAFEVSDLYNLRYARTGPFGNRVIFPIHLRGELVTWTGRAISKRSPVRYKTLSAKAEKKEDDLPLALCPITDTLWNFDNLYAEDADLLVICEGPFDALRVDYFGYEYGIRATCLYTKNVSQRQIELLCALKPRFRKILLVIDRDASLDIMRIMRKVVWLGAKMHVLTEAKDPALLSRLQVKGLRRVA